MGRRSKAEWLELLEDFEARQIGQEEYCRERKLSLSALRNQLYAWRRTRSAGDEPKSDESLSVKNVLIHQVRLDMLPSWYYKLKGLALSCRMAVEKEFKMAFSRNVFGKPLGALLAAIAISMLGTAGRLDAMENKTFQVIIVMDTVAPWSEGMRDGFKASLDKQLAASGAQAVYQVFDTKLDPATIPAIQAAIDRTKPDLICTLNFPSVFADNMITKLPANAKYRFVSENCVPLQSGLIKDLNRPGGNVTGVGVFIQMKSMLRLAKMINPKVRKLAVVTWDAMTQINEWFEAEYVKACKEEGLELVKFHRAASFEEEIDFYREYAQKGPEYLVLDGIGVFLHKDGSPADAKTETFTYREKLKHLLYLSYDEDSVRLNGVALAGTAVIWEDIGAQLAEKGFKILGGTKPGDLPWDQPRKYNIILNLETAKFMGYTFPENLVGAAYRVYTDLQGHFAGQ
jgi:putative ABC transport system substrate-binding protein